MPDPLDALAFATLVADAGDLRQEIADAVGLYYNWWSGTESGGTGSNGLYPLPVAGGGTVDVPCIARLRADLLLFSTPVVLTGTAYTLGTSPALSGRPITITNAGLITLTLPKTAAAGANAIIVQGGAGKVRAVTQAGAPTLLHRQSYDRTAGPNAGMTLWCQGNSDGNSAIWRAFGDMAA